MRYLLGGPINQIHPTPSGLSLMRDAPQYWILFFYSVQTWLFSSVTFISSLQTYQLISCSTSGLFV